MATPPLNVVKVFDAAVRLGSLKRAAGGLHIAPSPVARHIRTLADLPADDVDRAIRHGSDEYLCATPDILDQDALVLVCAPEPVLHTGNGFKVAQPG